MKKIYVVAMLCAFAMTGVNGYAQSVKKQLKQETKEIQARAKELSADGWKSDQSDGLSRQLRDHREKKRNNPDLMELSGDGQHSSLAVAKTRAREDATIQFADYLGGMIRGRVVTDMRDVNDEQADNFVAGYERILVQKLAKDVKPSYYIYKENGRNYQVRGFFYIDESVATKKANDALKEAAEEAGLTFDYANGVSDFIKQGFNQ